jgi:hypothetical protein
MARCPFANWNPVDFVGNLDPMGSPPKAVFFHTNGGGPQLTPWFNHLYAKTNERCGSTFQVFTDGKIDQLCDTESVIYAQYGASRWAVSVETEDDAKPQTPWSPQQLDAINRLLQWLTRRTASRCARWPTRTTRASATTSSSPSTTSPAMTARARSA